MNTGLFQIDSRRTFAFFALVSAVASVLLCGEIFLQRPYTNTAPIAYLEANRGRLIFGAALILTWAVVSIPLIAAFGTILGNPKRGLALAATILSATGIALLAFGSFTYAGAFLAILATATPTDIAPAGYHTFFWANLSYYLTDPGLMIWGLGQLLFGRLAWTTKAWPRWIAITGFTGGIMGLLTLAAYQSGIFALIQVICFAVWGFATARSLLH